MSIWIDANKLIEFINSKFVVSWKHDYDGGFKDACVEILNAIEDAPSIEIVRCGECKHYLLLQKNSPYVRRRRYCNKGAIKATSPDDFCSYGERKDQ